MGCLYMWQELPRPMQVRLQKGEKKADDHCGGRAKASEAQAMMKGTPTRATKVVAWAKETVAKVKQATVPMVDVGEASCHLQEHLHPH